MARIPEEIIEEIVSSIDLSAYIETRGIALRNDKARCPFPDHNDSTPSFSVKSSEQFFKCFGCGKGGDVISFIMNLDQISFPEAVKVAADYAGISIDQEQNFSPQEIADYNEMEMLKGIYVAAANYCYNIMPPDIKKHLMENYGFTEEYMEWRKPGFDDGHLFDHLYNEMGFEKEDLLKSGLFVKTKNGVKDFFNTRIVFWYWKRGFPVYAIARQTEYTKNLDTFEKYEQAKYKKLLTYEQKTEKKKGRTYVSELVQNKYIYNEDICLNPKKRPPYIVITEGITDAMIAEMLGIPVISPVTVRYRKEDLKKLKMLVKYIPAVYLANDNEKNEAGLKGSLDTGQFINGEGKRVYITILPRKENEDKVDMNMFLQGKTKEEWEEFANENSKLYQNFLLDEALNEKKKQKKKGADADSNKYWDLVNRAIYEAKDMKPMPREEFFKKLSKKFDLKKSAIEEQFKEVIKEEESKPENREKEKKYNEIFDRAKDQTESDAHKMFKGLLDKGAKFFRTGDTDVTMIYENKFYHIDDKKCPFTMFLMNELKQNYLEHKVKKLIWEFQAKAYKHATRLKKQTWLYCDKYEREIYFGVGYETNDIFKITPDKVKLVDNGGQGGIFVNPPDEIMEAWEYKADINHSKIAKDMYDIFTKYMPIREEDTLLLLMAVMVLPLKRFVDTTPIIKIHGESSAGKTQAAKKILHLMYGNETAIGNMTDASKFDQASVRPIIIFDNLENIKQGQLERFLLWSASGGSREKRDRNTESGTIKQIIDSLSILTAIHPFDKKELLNRSFDITANKVYHCYDKDVTVVNDEIREQRDDFLSLWVELVRQCLNDIEQTKEKRNEINKQFEQHFKERLNGYYSLMWLMADKFLSLVGYNKKEIKNLVFNWISYQSTIGTDNEKNTSEVFSYFENLASYIRYEKIDRLGIILDTVEQPDDGSVIIEATGNELLTAFKKIAKDIGEKFVYSNTQQLMARVSNDLEVLEENNWKVNLCQRIRSGINVHRFEHKFKNEIPIQEAWAKED